MVDLEGQDHGPSSSSVGDNDDDFIVYSKEGNNARWFKKEGDEVSAEDILCEVETVWPLFAMECAEEVFLAKIIHGDGAKVIKVGEDIEHKEVERKEFNTLYSVSISHHIHTFQKLQLHKVNATMVEDEDDIAKFKDYKPSQLGDSKEAKVPLSKIKGTSSDGTIVQADIEDYLAKENSLKPEDYEGGTFTVSNLGGTYGIKQFCAIINPPQSGILAVGSVEKRVVPGAGPDQYTFAAYMPESMLL
ncbi:hypothetical protein Sjap_017913 [Stephania japonica]|uniref:Dihydrolipoamide acetyltransferase component of pyruvate dehydrogenase complex n=1 Tax=Stephania japonica TaxID=461633 RepID=A0AAP0NK13_9MAGN